MLEIELSVYILSTYLNSKLDLPTPQSPATTTFSVISSGLALITTPKLYKIQFIITVIIDAKT